MTSTCFERQNVHPQEDLYIQFYGMFSCVHISTLVDVRTTHPAIDQTAYMDAWKHTIKLNVQVFLMMDISFFETCRRRYNWIKSSMKKVCILLVLITYVYHNATFKKRKNLIMASVFRALLSVWHKVKCHLDATMKFIEVYLARHVKNETTCLILYSAENHTLQLNV